MSTDQEEFVLGEDITAIAESKTRKGTVVLSVRLPLEEFSDVEAVSLAQGKTLSQVVREALKIALHINRTEQRTITISFLGGSTSTTGAPGQWGRATMATNAPLLEAIPA